MAFAAIGKSKKKLLVTKEALPSSVPLSNSGLTDVAVCMNGLKKVSLRAEGGSTELATDLTGTGRHSNGAAKLKRSAGGEAEEKTRTPDLDGDTDDAGGWEKGRPSWKKVRQKQGWKGGKMQKKSSLIDDCDDDASVDYVPNKKRSDNKLCARKASQPRSVYTQPDQRVRGTDHSQPTLH